MQRHPFTSLIATAYHGLHFGVSNGARTRDIGHHKAALYQLSYTHHVSRAWRATRKFSHTPGANDETAAAAAARAPSLVGPGSGTKTAER